ncbi:MAG: gephyrin-like molybdotransferase Glp [Hyphomicrobiaceae bacterium]|nr:molybdopterin molybdotransferase MoeA [Hyphomicrobiaceae bacterium]
MTRKLLDDCFLHDQDRLRHDDAIALLISRVTTVVGEEHVPLDHCAGRTLSTALHAAQPVPAFTNSAVDGYAFAHRDAVSAASPGIPVVDRVAAGHARAIAVPQGHAVRIFTGAALPPGVDTVAMQEDCAVNTIANIPHVTIPVGLKPSANVRKAGEDVAANTELFIRGNIIRPQDIAALASIGIASVPVYKRLRVAILSSGDEIIRPGTQLTFGQVYDANAPMIASLARSAGCDVTDLGIAPDREADVEAVLANAAARFDVIITSGGASRGEEDHLITTLDKLGKRHMWQLAIKPGRPMALGQIGNCVVLGLPGNPVAVFVCFLLYAFPMLRALGGAPWHEPRRLYLPAKFSFEGRKTGRREFWRGALVDTASGLAVDKYNRDGSGLISGLRWADGLIDIPEDLPEVRVGQPVGFISFSEFGISSR